MLVILSTFVPTHLQHAAFVENSIAMCSVLILRFAEQLSRFAARSPSGDGIGFSAARRTVIVTIVVF